jgi:hypothetical protein
MALPTNLPRDHSNTPNVVQRRRQRLADVGTAAAPSPQLRAHAPAPAGQAPIQHNRLQRFRELLPKQLLNPQQNQGVADPAKLGRVPTPAEVMTQRVVTQNMSPTRGAGETKATWRDAEDFFSQANPSQTILSQRDTLVNSGPEGRAAAAAIDTQFKSFKDEYAMLLTRNNSEITEEELLNQVQQLPSYNESIYDDVALFVKGHLPTQLAEQRKKQFGIKQEEAAFQERVNKNNGPFIQKVFPEWDGEELTSDQEIAVMKKYPGKLLDNQGKPMELPFAEQARMEFEIKQSQQQELDDEKADKAHLEKQTEATNRKEKWDKGKREKQAAGTWDEKQVGSTYNPKTGEWENSYGPENAPKQTPEETKKAAKAEAKVDARRTDIEAYVKTWSSKGRVNEGTETQLIKDNKGGYQWVDPTAPGYAEAAAAGDFHDAFETMVPVFQEQFDSLIDDYQGTFVTLKEGRELAADDFRDWYYSDLSQEDKPSAMVWAMGQMSGIDTRALFEQMRYQLDRDKESGAGAAPAEAAPAKATPAKAAPAEAAPAEAAPAKAAADDLAFVPNEEQIQRYNEVKEYVRVDSSRTPRNDAEHKTMMRTFRGLYENEFQHTRVSLYDFDGKHMGSSDLPGKELFDLRFNPGTYNPSIEQLADLDAITILLVGQMTGVDTKALANRMRSPKNRGKKAADWGSK